MASPSDTALRHAHSCLPSSSKGFVYQASRTSAEAREESPDPNDFPGLGTLSHALLAFVNRYNRTARPFNWKFTADDLTALLRRTSQREQVPASQQADRPQAA